MWFHIWQCNLEWCECMGGVGRWLRFPTWVRTVVCLIHGVIFLPWVSYETLLNFWFFFILNVIILSFLGMSNTVTVHDFFMWNIWFEIRLRCFGKGWVNMGSREVIKVSTWVRSVVFTPFMGFDETSFLLIWGDYYLYPNKLPCINLW